MFRPITKSASSSLGTAHPTSRQAFCRLPAITRVESMSVPSQSKITRSYLPTLLDLALGDLPATELLEVARQRRLEPHGRARHRMREGERVRVQEHALE